MALEPQIHSDCERMASTATMRSTLLSKLATCLVKYEYIVGTPMKTVDRRSCSASNTPRTLKRGRASTLPPTYSGSSSALTTPWM